MATQRQTLRVQLDHALIRISELEAQLADTQTKLLATQSPRAIKTVARTPWVRPAYMEAARQLAMSGHCVVKV